MRVLVDTNVLLDYCFDRDPYSEYATKIVEKCKDGTVSGYIAAHSIPNMFFIMRKEYSIEERRILLKQLCVIFEVVGIDRGNILSALDNEAFDDFEDCLQYQCAKSIEANYIVTRNPKDFVGGDIPCISPEAFCNEHLTEEK